VATREPAGSSPASEPDSGTLRVLRPSGASEAITVVVDGQPRGEAPLTLELPPGRHVVQYRQGDRQSSFAPVTIRPGETWTATPQITR